MRDEFEDIPEVDEPVAEPDAWAGIVAENHESDHERLARLTEEFLANGGQIQVIEPGVSTADTSQAGLLAKFAMHTGGPSAKEARERMEQMLDRKYAKARANDAADTQRIREALDDPEVKQKKDLIKRTGLRYDKIYRLLMRYLSDHPRYPWFARSSLGTLPKEVIAERKQILQDAIDRGVGLNDLPKLLHLSRPALRNFAVENGIRLPERKHGGGRPKKCAQ